MKKLILEEEPWKKVPIELIIEEEERKKREIEHRRPQPTVYDTDVPPYTPPKREEKKESERGVAVIKFY